MDVERVAVIGAGTMGAGIAQLAATRGCRVTLIDVSADVVKRAMGSIGDRLARSEAKGRITADEREAILARLTSRTDIGDLADVQLAVEAVVEDMNIKRRVFASLEAATGPEAVLATNTSSLRVSDIASAVGAPGRVVGMHFFNPAPVMPLVEIIAADRTDESALVTAETAARAWGKVPVRAKDTPGFIVNRVARGFYLEALRMLGEGVADVERIDRTMCEFCGFKMGPFQLMDLVGLDVNYAVSTSVWQQFGRPVRLTPHEIQRELLDQGHLGRKTGRGFYRYDCDPPAVDLTRSVTAVSMSGEVSNCVTEFARAVAGREVAPTESYIIARILGAVMNEASLALDEQVASAADIDIAMQKGTNYPQGPLAWADQIGRDAVGRLLSVLDQQCGDGRFTPAPPLPN